MPFVGRTGQTPDPRPRRSASRLRLSRSVVRGFGPLRRDGHRGWSDGLSKGRSVVMLVVLNSHGGRKRAGVDQLPQGRLESRSPKRGTSVSTTRWSHSGEQYPAWLGEVARYRRWGSAPGGPGARVAPPATPRPGPPPVITAPGPSPEASTSATVSSATRRCLSSR